MKKFELEGTVIFDTESMGLGSEDEIIEIGIINGQSGEVLLQTLVKPLRPIPSQATSIHGITNNDVENAPMWSDVLPKLLKILEGSKLAAYNLDFDRRMLIQTSLLHEVQQDLINYLDMDENYAPCAMLWYADYYGEWNEYRGCNRWQKLVNAAKQQGVDVSDLRAHRASDDCEITRRLIHVVNNKISG